MCWFFFVFFFVFLFFLHNRLLSHLRGPRFIGGNHLEWEAGDGLGVEVGPGKEGPWTPPKISFDGKKWVRRLPLVHPKYFRRDPVAVRASRHVSAKYQVLIITWLFSSGQLDNTAGCDLGLSALTGRTAERWLNYNGGKCSFSPWAPGISESYRLHGVRRLTYL